MRSRLVSVRPVVRTLAGDWVASGCAYIHAYMHRARRVFSLLLRGQGGRSVRSSIMATDWRVCVCTSAYAARFPSCNGRFGCVCSP